MGAHEASGECVAAKTGHALISLRGDDPDEELRCEVTEAFELVATTLRDPEKALCQDAAVVLDVCPGTLVTSVIDGMGGMANGREAARLAASAFESIAPHSTSDAAIRSDIAAAFTRAHADVVQHCPGGGATAVAALVSKDWVQVLHAGDAEAIVISRSGRVRFRTVAHSPVGYARYAGVLDEEEALHHAERHLVSNGLGVEGMSVHVSPRIPFANGDTLLVATDGVTDNARESEIATTLRSGSLAVSTEQLVRLCRDRMNRSLLVPPSTRDAIGKPDDLSLVTVRRRAR